MPSLGIVILLTQAACIVHALKYGQERWWIWLIAFFPVGGCALYVASLLLADVRSDNLWRQLRNLFDPRKELRRHAENLHMADTVANRIQLAEEYMRHGMPNEAIALYEKSLTGLYRDDPQMLFGLAHAYFAAADYPQSQETLERLMTRHATYKALETRLLHARTSEALGQTESARREYTALCTAYPGPEAQYWYALMLKNHGDNQAAQGIFQNILTTAKRMPRHYRTFHREWLSRVRRELV